MNFVYGRNHWKTSERAEENCYLLTNRKGGYSSLTQIGSSARNEHVLFMASVKAPNQWVQMISNLEETIYTEKGSTSLMSQEFVGYTKNKKGYQYLNGFSMNPFPRWHYLAEGVSVDKTLVMKYEENLLMITYVFENHTQDKVEISVRPWMRFTPKGTMPTKGERGEVTRDRLRRGGYELYYLTDGELKRTEEIWQEDLYFRDDAKDERSAVGAAFSDHRYEYLLGPGERREAYILYSMNPIHDDPRSILRTELERKASLIRQSGMESPLGRQLVLAADAFVVDRESTGGRTIIAGYPFFGDWGRDTMIAVMGCCIASGRKEDTENIFRSFMKYVQKGIMPNMFPEGDQEPMYNTVDASLLFIYAVYEYYLEFRDLDFVREAMPVMKDIISWYMRGTDFHIRMEEDSLISAGGGFEQVTWMDIRIGDLLPTPRHGKPVEINAYWYNDLRIMEYFTGLLGMEEGREYGLLAEKVRVSFNEKFWNEEQKCLRDLVSGSQADDQIRCNQIWAVSVPFSILDRERERQVVEKVYSELYTPYGLRSLSPQDPEYHPFYGGSLYHRDTAYHQGTVWGFPLGAYYLSYLKVNGYSEASREKTLGMLALLEGTLREGCIGQIAEIFDGDDPSTSKGCFAQAWSVGELLRALKAATGKRE